MEEEGIPTTANPVEKALIELEKQGVDPNIIELLRDKEAQRLELQGKVVSLNEEVVRLSAELARVKAPTAASQITLSAEERTALMEAMPKFIE